MAIEFHCRQCNSVLRIREQDTGKKIRCPRCGMIGDAPPSGGGPAATMTSGEPSFAAPETGTTAHAEAASFRIDEQSDRWSMQTPDGNVYGPVSRDELDGWETEGRISAACLVQQAGQSHWQSALVLYPHLAGARMAGQGSSRGVRNPVSQSGGRRVATGPTRPRRNNGVAVLAMGVLGLFIFYVPVFALIAWGMGGSEIRAIQRGEASGENRYLVDIGYYLGMISSLLGLTVWLGCCLLSQL